MIVNNRKGCSIVQEILKESRDQHMGGFYPIHAAIKAGNPTVLDMIKHCTHHGLQLRDSFARTPLIFAALFKEEIVGQLILRIRNDLRC